MTFLYVYIMCAACHRLTVLSEDDNYYPAGHRVTRKDDPF